MAAAMADYELKDNGDGQFSLSGEMTFDTAERILAKSERPFEQHTRIEVDLSGVTQSDSAGLALLLEWVTWANHTVFAIAVTRAGISTNRISRTV